jgi:asparagine synthase (glutamine-hydrolysing)
MLMVCQYGSQNFKVVLTGDGGDELFGGYTWYRNLDAPLSKLAGWWRGALRPLIKRNASPNMRQHVAKYFSQTSVLHRHAWRLYPRFLPEEAESLFSPMSLRFGDEEMLAPLRKHYELSLPLQRALQRVDLMTFCSDSILAKVDRASMAYSLEVRVPFLDRRMAEWALSHPLDVRERTESKLVFRDYLRTRIPHAVLDRPKQGFSLRVLNDFDWNSALNRIRASKWVQDGYWAMDWEKLVVYGVPYREARIWNLLILSYWADYWLEKR